MCDAKFSPVLGAIASAANLAGIAADAPDTAAGARAEARYLAARGAREAAQLRRQNAQDRAQYRVAMAKAGVTEAGSPTDTLLDLTVNGERDARWAQLGYDEQARSRLRDARRVQRKGLLDSLSGSAELGNQLIKL